MRHRFAGADTSTEHPSAPPPFGAQTAKKIEITCALGENDYHRLPQMRIIRAYDTVALGGFRRQPAIVDRSLIAALFCLALGCGAPPGSPGTDAGTRAGDGGCPSCDAGQQPRDTGVADVGEPDAAIDGGSIDAGPGDSGPDGGPSLVPETYTFTSRYDGTASSVAYSGQVARQLLALDLRRFIDGLDAAIAGPTMSCGDAGPYDPRDVTGDGTIDSMADTVMADLMFRFGMASPARHATPHGAADLPAGTSATPATYGEISMTAFIDEKVGGNDPSTDHRDWSTAFVGFATTGAFRRLPGGSVDVSSPRNLLMAIFTTIAMNAEDEYACNVRMVGAIALPVHISSAGHHLGQLSEKFLLGAMNFSQGVDDYLDDEPGDPGKGLLSPNTRDGTHPYTVLEHAWDEGYGYFGAPRHGSMIPLAELVGSSRGFDANADSMIDVRSEYLYPSARYAALRDDGSAATARTSFFADAHRAFRTGRAILARAPEGAALSAEDLAALTAQRDIIVDAWERALAASTITYINDVIAWTLAIDTPGATYEFLRHVGTWSEMKAFAMAFQFNRRSPMLVTAAGEERFVTLHELLGDAPVLASATPAERTAYVADLIAARTILADAFGFDPANVGDATGAMGW